MKITVHYPADREAIQELARRVAEAHVQAVIHAIGRLPCPPEQKKRIFEQILEEAKKRGP